MKLSDIEFIKIVPEFMKNDEAVKAFCQALDKLLEPCSRTSTLSTWASFGELTESECDELAWELDVDWYDYNATIEQKRAAVSSAQQIKRKRGTKWAVEQLVSSYFGNGKIIEWFEEGGAPFTFSATSENPEISDEMYAKFIQAVNAAKSERSKLSRFTHEWNISKEIQAEADIRFISYSIPVCGAFVCGQEVSL